MTWTRDTSTHDVGDKPRVTCTFTDVDTSTKVDPNTVSVTVTDPTGTATTYVYGTDAEVIRDSAGVYHTDVLLNIEGRWTVRWFSSGSYEAAAVQYLIAVG